MEFVDFINVGSIVAMTFASVVGVQLWRKQGLVEEQSRKILSQKHELEKASERISVLEEFCKTVSTTETEKHSVIIIGPRASGKSSIVSLWCEVDRLIETISPTVSFDTYDYDAQVSKKEDYFDSKIKVNRIKRIEKVIRFFDYAGEDNQIPNAIENITKSPDCTIIMVFITYKINHTSPSSPDSYDFIPLRQ